VALQRSRVEGTGGLKKVQRTSLRSRRNVRWGHPLIERSGTSGVAGLCREEARSPSPFSSVTLFFFVETTKGKTQAKEPDMAKNHYTTKPKRRNRSGKRKDTRRIAANMSKIRQLERSAGRTE
jgi:hypothetical protein